MDDMLDRLAEAVAQRQKPIVIRSDILSGGVNNRYSPLYIKENQVAELTNATLDDVTRPAIRDGYSVMLNMTGGLEGSTTASGVNHTYNRIAGAAELHASSGTKFVFVAIDATASGECFYRSSVAAGGSWSIATTDGTNSYAPLTDEVVVFQANDGLVVVGDQSTNVHTFSVAGTLYDGLDLNTSPPLAAVDGCYMLSRIWLLKDGTASTPPEVHYSKLLPDMTDPSTQFNRNGTGVSTTIAGRLQLSPNKGGQGRAIEAWNETSLMVFFDSSIEEVVIVSSNPQADSLRRVIEPNIGCASRFSVVSVGREMFFADQFGQIRSLQQTVTSAQGGVVPKPLSEPIASEIPGRVNLNALGKIRMWVFKDKLYVAYPRNAAAEATAIAVFSLSNGIWESIWIPKHAVGQIVVSDIRAKGEDMWMTDAGTDATTGVHPMAGNMYRWFDESYLDNGSSIVYTEVSRAYHFGVPEADKLARAYEIEGSGDAQVSVATSIGIDEGGTFYPLDEPFLIDVPTGGSFPLIDPDDFAVIDPTDFPLSDGAQGETARKKYTLSQLPNCGRGRAFQVKLVVSTDDGKRFKRSGYRLMLDQEPYEDL